MFTTCHLSSFLSTILNQLYIVITVTIFQISQRIIKGSFFNFDPHQDWKIHNSDFIKSDTTEQRSHKRGQLIMVG